MIHMKCQTLFSLKNKNKNFAEWLYVATPCGVQEMELKTQVKYCSAKHEKLIKVSNDRWQCTGCNMDAV